MRQSFMEIKKKRCLMGFESGRSSEKDDIQKHFLIKADK